MKFLLTASVIAFSLSAFADMNMKGMKGKSLEEQKQMMNSKVDRKVEALQASKTCIGSAQDEKALKACMKDEKEAMEDIKESWKKQKEEKIEQKEESLDKEKEQVENLDE